MSFRSRRATMRPAREFSVVLRARDQQVNSLQDNNDALNAQLDALERRLTNARANAHADARAQQLQERKIEQLREKLHDSRGGSAALRRELEDVRRESETQRMRLAKADEENLRHRARIAELEAALQTKSPQELTRDVEHHHDDDDDAEFEGVSRDDILDVLTQVAIDLEAVARMTEELPLFDQSSESVPRAARANKVEMGIQTISDGVLGATSEQDQHRIQELEVELEHGRRLNEELRNAVEEERRLVQDLKASSAQERSRIASLVDAEKRDQEAIKVLEATVDEYHSDIDSAEAQVALLRTLLEVSRTFNNDLEESYNSIVACKDVFIQDLQERVEELAASKAWSQQREATLHNAQDRLAAADIEILELRLELEGAQRNAVMSTNRIIQLEAKSSAARHRLRTTEATEADLRDELGVAFERVYALEDELVAAQGRLDSAENATRQLRRELDRYVNAPTRLPNGPSIRDDIHDVNDTDTASDEGSIDTLVMDPDEHSQPRLSSGTKDGDSPVSAKQDELLSPPLSVRALETRLEAMTLKYEAAEAARICGEDVENILRAKLRDLSKDDPRPSLSTALALVEQDPDVRADSPSEEWHSLPTIPEEEEPNISPALERVAPPRIQTRSLIVAKHAVPQPTTITIGNEQAESPLLPSPTLSDIWFSDMLALVGTGSSVLDWELPSPGGDSDSS